MEKTYIMLKPDAVKRKLIGDIISRIENKGYEITEMKMFKLTEEILKEHLNEINLIYKQVLILFYFDDFTIKEINEILGEKEGTIKSKLSRGRKILGESLVKGGKFNEL